MKMVKWMVSILMVVLVALITAMAAFAMQSTASVPQGSSTAGTGSVESHTSQMEDTSGNVQSNISSNSSSEQSVSINESENISLPSVSVGSEVGGIISNGTDITPSNSTQTLLGIVFWVCIVIGIIVVVVVIVAATRKPPKGGTGKKRYERRPMTPKGKRILNEKYYRNIKK